jgi:di/tricarboxylate transporter
MIAYVVLASIALLLALLIRGRQPPALLFGIWAVAYLLFGMVKESFFLHSFTNSALSTLIVLLMVSLALERSPVLDWLSEKLIRGTTTIAVFRLSIVTVAFSAFLNNTAVVGALLGVVTKQQRVAASKLLIPLSYAAIFGGVVTLVGTSTNLVVNSFAVNAGMPAIGMFQLAWVGLPAALVGTAVLLVVTRWLPEHRGTEDEARQPYFLEARVVQESPLVGSSIEENRLRSLNGLFLAEILRGERLISPVTPDEIVEAGDILIFSGETQKVQALGGFQGLVVFGTETDSLLKKNLIEVVISNQSELPNNTLRDVDFRTMFDAAVVGIRRGDRRLTGQLGRIPLRVGDSLILAVGADFHLHRNIHRNFHVLDESLLPPRLNRLQNTIGLSGFAAVIACSAAGWFSLLNGLLALLLLLLACKALTLGELRRRFPFDLAVIIGSALTLAEVLEKTGGAALIAGAVHYVFSDFGVYGALVGVYLMTMLLTELVANNAAAALAFPVAVSSARAFGVDPLPFVMVILYGASAGFILPFGYQTHMMVYSPGRYRLIDFVRCGLPTSLAFGVTVLLLVPVFFPFK